MKKNVFFLLLPIILFSGSLVAQVSIRNETEKKQVTFGNSQIQLTLDYNKQCVITSMLVQGEEVLSKENGIHSMIKIGPRELSSLNLKTSPSLSSSSNQLVIRNIIFGSGDEINETWIFKISTTDVDFVVERQFLKPLQVDEVGFPNIHFKDIHTWNGAFLDHGGLAWFYLFNSPLSTYGVHSSGATFWNSTNGNALRISTSSNDHFLVSKFTREISNELQYAVTVSDKEVLLKHDPGTQRRRYLHDRADVWAPFIVEAGKYRQTTNFKWIDYNEEYGRGKLTGLDGLQVSMLLNTIARIGVIDKNHFGGNSWHTPYGPICLHEQYIAQMGIGINDPRYINGYKDCLVYYRDHAIKSDGRVLARWAYTDEDAMKGSSTDKGFYEAQWGYLMDSNPDFVSNVSDTYQQSGDINWVRGFKSSCEKALDYMLNRDFNGNHLVEMLNDNSSEGKGSDWIDIVWASYENAFVNAKLYRALISWAEIEKHLGDQTKASYYSDFAVEMKKSFNKSTSEGGFWDATNKWYIYWRNKDQTIHGNNLVTPVNLMAISYGICDDVQKSKAILDQLEKQMKQENLFAWPLCMYPYSPGEARTYQFPFPEYENGDIFLSWGSVFIDAYAKYNPELALKYVRNILSQYKKDGLAFQRYQRNGQQGAGDDILSGNALGIVGLYISIYGINPRYNRLYLDPHLPESLSGTELNYHFRGERLQILLNKGAYSIRSKQFQIKSPSSFGFNGLNNTLEYYHADNNGCDLSAQVKNKAPLRIEIIHWDPNQSYLWKQSGINAKNMVSYTISNLAPNKSYSISVDSKVIKTIISDKSGCLNFKTTANAISSTVRIMKE